MRPVANPSQEPAAWSRFAAYERGRAKGEADRAAGRSEADWSAEDDLGVADAMAFVAGYGAGYRADEPATAPLPLWLALPWSIAGGEASAWTTPGGRRSRPRTALLVAGVFLVSRLDQRLRQWRARREGDVRKGDAFPGLPVLRRVAVAFAINAARRWDRRRRGVWPPSGATLAGDAMTNVLLTELAWRRTRRQWQAWLDAQSRGR